MTFSDLARQLNVSTATVSRALSRPEIVAPATRKRVLEAVQRSGGEGRLQLGTVHVVVVRDILKLHLHVMSCVPGGHAIHKPFALEA